MLCLLSGVCLILSPHMCEGQWVICSQLKIVSVCPHVGAPFSSFSFFSFASFLLFLFFFCLFFRMSVFHILPNIHKTSYLAFLPKRQLHNKYKAEIRGHEWILIKRKLRDHSNNVLITSLFKYFKVF